MTDPLDCHVFLVVDGDEAAIVDTGIGTATDAILERVARAGVDAARITSLVITHGHADHVGGAASLLAHLSRARVCAPAECAAALRSGDEERLNIAAGRRAGFVDPGFRFAAVRVDRELVDGDRIEVGSLALTALATPGHAREHMAFLLERRGENVLFSGDALFAGGHIHMLTFPDTDLQSQIATLRRLRSLKVDVLLPGHGQLALSDGAAHVELANAALDRFLLPPLLMTA